VFVRKETLTTAIKTYEDVDCPGIDTGSRQPFPVITTLLSIPFSLLHTLPRLSALTAISPYQNQLIIMATEISQIWYWDPSPDLIKKSLEICIRDTAANRLDTIRGAKPNNINHPSRSGIKFSTMLPSVTYGPPNPSSMQSRSQDQHAIQLPSGQVVFGTTPVVSWDKAGLLLTSREEELADMGDAHKQHACEGIVAPSITHLSSATSEAWDVQTPEGGEDLDNIGGVEDVSDVKPTISPSSCDISTWIDNVVIDPGAEPPTLTPSSFKKGVIGSMSVNDILMIKGCIEVPAYTQFLDLRSFSCR
jgi:hypothetical protein